MIEMLEILLKYYNQFESEIKSNNSDLKRFQYLHRLLTAFHRLSYLVPPGQLQLWRAFHRRGGLSPRHYCHPSRHRCITRWWVTRCSRPTSLGVSARAGRPARPRWRATRPSRIRPRPSPRRSNCRIRTRCPAPPPVPRRSRARQRPAAQPRCDRGVPPRRPPTGSCPGYREPGAGATPARRGVADAAGGEARRTSAHQGIYWRTTPIYNYDMGV
jgi:hypothetical protein